MKPVRLSSAAEGDVTDALTFYEQQAPALGSGFLEELANALAAIREFPVSGTQTAPGMRRALLRRFPFGVLYVVHADEILVLAVMHLHRQPDAWRQRW